METVERALEQHGPPVYVRKQIVHNSHVVDELSARGAIFVGSVEDVPKGGLVVFSAHGIAPAVRAGAVDRSLRTIDATCPLVTKVHAEFPRLHGPEKEDICYATTNRQRAVKDLLRHVQLLLVVGSANSSNSQRLVEVAQASGVPAYLIEGRRDLEEGWLADVDTVGITSGASAPEVLVEGVCDWFRGRGVADIRELSPAEENVVFKLPAELRRSAA